VVDGDAVDDAAVVAVGAEGLAGVDAVEGDDLAAGYHFCQHNSNEK
jgi:hypothetical protein